jgi:hypothetical protein
VVDGVFEVGEGSGILGCPEEELGGISIGGEKLLAVVSLLN